MGDEETVREIERGLLRIVRLLGKRNLGQMMERTLEGLVDFSHVAVVDALGGGNNKEQATIGQIARSVGLDHSRASRMVAAAIRAGYAKRMASQEDGRRTCVALTEKGLEFAAAIRNVRHKFFVQHLKGWSKEDRRVFARLLMRFAQANRQDQTGRVNEPAPSGTATNVVVLPPRAARKGLKRQRIKQM
jgi:DNA-binding MarR family transcriptional regulator